MFKAIGSVFSKSKSSAFLETILEIHGPGLGINSNYSKLAFQLIDDAWESEPTLFDGTYNERPAKYSIVAMALALAVASDMYDDNMQFYFATCFVALLKDMEAYSHFYPLSEVDDMLLAISLGVFNKASEGMYEENRELLDELESIAG